MSNQRVLRQHLLETQVVTGRTPEGAAFRSRTEQCVWLDADMLRVGDRVTLKGDPRPGTLWTVKQIFEPAIGIQDIDRHWRAGGVVSTR